jgi:hypothetical protein
MTVVPIHFPPSTPGFPPALHIAIATLQLQHCNCNRVEGLAVCVAMLDILFAEKDRVQNLPSLRVAHPAGSAPKT